MNKAGRIKKSLYREMTVALILLIALVAIVANLVNYAYSSHLAEQHYQNRITEYDNSLRESMEQPLWHIDDELIKKLGNAFLVNKDVNALTVRDEKQRVIFHLDKLEHSEIGSKLTIQHNGKNIGDIEFELSQKEFSDNNQMLLLTSLANAAFLLLVLVFAVRWILTKLLKKPLNDLVGAIDDIIEGEYQNTITTVSYIEFSPVILGVNSIAEAVASRELSLKQSNKNLEAEYLERKHAEELWSYALEGAGDGVWDLNVKTKAVEFTKQWKAMIGYAEDEFENSFSVWKSHVHPDDLPPTIAQLQDCLSGEIAIYHPEFRMRCKDGSWKWILARGKVVALDETGASLRMIGTHTDITERKQAEAELIKKSSQLEELNEHLEHRVNQRTHELSQANEQLNDLLDKLTLSQNELIESEKMASLGGLVAGIAHEINTPIGIGLTGMSHFDEEIKTISTKYHDDDLSESDFKAFLEDAAELSSAILSSLKHAAEQIRSFKRVAVDQSQNDVYTFPLKEYFEEVILSLHNLLKKTKHRVIINIDEDLKITSDPGSFAQIITNMVTNSLLHAFHNIDVGEITISAIEQDEKIIVDYKDNGVGIPVEHQKKIFDPFFTTKRNKGGTGLGLNIIYNIVSSRLSGSVKVHHPDDGGVHFSFSFPKEITNKSKVIG